MGRNLKEACFHCRKRALFIGDLSIPFTGVHCNKKNLPSNGFGREVFHGKKIDLVIFPVETLNPEDIGKIGGTTQKNTANKESGTCIRTDPGIHPHDEQYQGQPYDCIQDTRL